MAKMNIGASTYRVTRRKAEIAREAKWQKTAKLVTKKSLETKKPETPEPIEPKAPESKKGR